MTDGKAKDGLGLLTQAGEGNPHRKVGNRQEEDICPHDNVHSCTWAEGTPSPKDTRARPAHPAVTCAFAFPSPDYSCSHFYPVIPAHLLTLAHSSETSSNINPAVHPHSTHGTQVWIPRASPTGPLMFLEESWHLYFEQVHVSKISQTQLPRCHSQHRQAGEMQELSSCLSHYF